jgi:hypothetical protein
MTLTPFEQILIGHLVGDYVCQNQWMAQRKGAHLFPCIVHCLIYTLCLCLTVQGGLNPWWALVVFISHLPIDRWSLADRWLGIIHGRTLEGFLNHGHEDMPKANEMSKRKKHNLLVLRGSFAAIVYCVVDNTFHLVLMVWGYQVLKAWGLM